MVDLKSNKLTQIGIAVVLEKSQVIVGTRGAGVHLAGKDEFPGGKCELNEDPETCAERECFEECGLIVVVDSLLHREQYHYPEKSVELSFFLCRLKYPSLSRQLKKPFRWVDHHKLSELNFPDGNRQALAKLMDVDFRKQ